MARCVQCAPRRLPAVMINGSHGALKPLWPKKRWKKPVEQATNERWNQYYSQQSQLAPILLLRPQDHRDPTSGQGNIIMTLQIDLVHLCKRRLIRRQHHRPKELPRASMMSSITTWCQPSRMAATRPLSGTRSRGSRERLRCASPKRPTIEGQLRRNGFLRRTSVTWGESGKGGKRMGSERGDGKGRGRGEEARRDEGGTEAGTEAGAGGGGGSVIGDDHLLVDGYGKYDLWNDMLDNVARIEERSRKKIIAAMLDPMHSNLSYTILVVFWTMCMIRAT